MSQTVFQIRQDDLSSAATQGLLALHLAGMRQASPADGVFALDLAALKHPQVTVWTAWAGHEVAAVGALKMLDAKSGEIKSMRTHPTYLRQGAGALLLGHLLAVAQERGVRRLSLETGSGPEFAPAAALYRAFGFEEGEAFSTYTASTFNQFLHRSL